MRAASLVLASALVLAAPLAHADGPALRLDLAAPAPASIGTDLRLAEAVHADDDKRHHALVLRNTGIALTVAGTVATIAGSVLMVYGFSCIADSCSEPHASTAGGEFIGGSTLLVAGQAAALSGSALWWVGQVRANRAEQPGVRISATGARITF